MTILANELEALGKRGDMGLLFRKLYNNLDTIISALRYSDAMHIMIEQKGYPKDGERATSAKSNSGRASGKGSRSRNIDDASPRAVSSVTEE